MYGPGLALSDINIGILYMLAVSSLSTYGILLAGWSANSKYAFLGSLRSTAQLISYELILSSAILLVVMLTGSLNITVNIEAQRAIWFIVPLLPIFIIFFIGSIAETNRAPFDLAEAIADLASLKITICWKPYNIPFSSYAAAIEAAFLRRSYFFSPPLLVRVRLRLLYKGFSLGGGSQLSSLLRIVAQEGGT